MINQESNTEKLLRQVLTSIAQLPPNDLLVVYETISALKQKDKSGKSAFDANEILLRAKAHASELKNLSHARFLLKRLQNHFKF